MKGATTDPWETNSKPPKIKKIKIIGASHNFFLTIRNDSNSLIIFIIKTDCQNFLVLLHLRFCLPKMYLI